MQQPMQPQRQPEGFRASSAQAFGLLYNVSVAIAFAVTPFIRRHFGRRAFDPHVGFTLMGLLMLAATYEVFRLYAAIWFVLVLGHRFRDRNLRVHSKYPGEPVLAMRLAPKLGEEKARHVEPFICVAFGLVAMVLSEELALFYYVAAAAITVKLVIEEFLEKALLRSMQDAEFEMDYYSQKYRERG